MRCKSQIKLAKSKIKPQNHNKMRTKQKTPLSEEEKALVMEGLLSRKIWRFYELLAKWAPILLMLGHWYGVWDYGHYP